MSIDDPPRSVSEEPAVVAHFERLFRAEVDRVYSYARSRLGEAEADDVVSDVFHAAALAVRDGNQASVTGAWLMAVTKNKVIDRWRQAQADGKDRYRPGSESRPQWRSQRFGRGLRTPDR